MVKLWYPKDGFVPVNDKGPVYLMSATHRGDMYHMRAAMEIIQRPLVLYDCSQATKQLVDYLTKVATKNNQRVFTVPWSSEVLVGSGNQPPNLNDCLLDGNQISTTPGVLAYRWFDVIGESAATNKISGWDCIPDSVITAMAILTNESKTLLDGQFQSLFESQLKNVKKNPASILVQYRDTGTQGGVYPELDSGVKSIEEIATAIQGIPRNSESYGIVVAGNNPDTTPVGKFPTLGEYWKLLKNPNGETARDVEAYFLKWAYDNGYFKMAVGFRSGALDLLTFLGIPTVSIGLRNMIGEPRHNLLAKVGFKRVNIEYDQPRQIATSWVKGHKGSPPVLSSTFWDRNAQAPDDAKNRRTIPTTEDQKKALYSQLPNSFASFDGVVLKIGLRTAIQLHHADKPQPLLLQLPGLDSNNTLITTREARFCYPAEILSENRKAYFSDAETMDRKDLATRKASEILQEPPQEEEMYQGAAVRDWGLVNGYFASLEPMVEADVGQQEETG